MDNEKKQNLVLFNTLKKKLEPFKPIGKKNQLKYMRLIGKNLFYRLEKDYTEDQIIRHNGRMYFKYDDKNEGECKSWRQHR